MTTVLALDPSMWTFLFLILAYLSFLGLGLGLGISRDNVLWLTAGLIPAGAVMLMLSFQAWTMGAGYLASISLAMVGLLTILLPVTTTIRSMTR